MFLLNIQRNKKAMNKYIAIVCLLFVGACAKPITTTPRSSSFAIQQELQLQKEMSLRGQVDEKDELEDILWPINVKNVELCPSKAFSLGLDLWSVYEFKGDDTDVAQDALGVGKATSVHRVFANSPAQKAGIKEGDVVIKISGKFVPQDKKARAFTKKVLKNHGNKPVTMRLSRDGRSFDVKMAPVPICNYPLVYHATDRKSDTMNAFADGQKIHMTRRFMKAYSDKDDLAMILSHELAHNTMNHMEKKVQNVATGVLIGTALDIISAQSGTKTYGGYSVLGFGMGSQSYSVDFEREADYVGMYMMARAGYDTSNVANIWRRMAVEFKNGPNEHAITHPTTPDRFIAINATHKEITQKIANGQALYPNNWKQQ